MAWSSEIVHLVANEEELNLGTGVAPADLVMPSSCENKLFCDDHDLRAWPINAKAGLHFQESTSALMRIEAAWKARGSTPNSRTSSAPLQHQRPGRNEHDHQHWASVPTLRLRRREQGGPSLAAAGCDRQYPAPSIVDKPIDSTPLMCVTSCSPFKLLGNDERPSPEVGRIRWQNRFNAGIVILPPGYPEVADCRSCSVCRRLSSDEDPSDACNVSE